MLISEREGVGMPTRRVATPAASSASSSVGRAQVVQSSSQAEIAAEETFDQQAYLRALENYKKLSNVALAKLQAGDPHEAANLFKQAYDYASKVKFEDGMTWLQEQISYCNKLIEQAKQQKEKKSYPMICRYCNVQYKVPKPARYRCPKCGTELEKLY